MQWKQVKEDSYGRPVADETWVAYVEGVRVASVQRNVEGRHWWLFFAPGSSGSTNGDNNDPEAKRATFVDAISSASCAYAHSVHTRG